MSRSTDLTDNGFPAYLRQFTGSALVECPRCGRCAHVVARDGDESPRLTCPHCSCVREGWPAPDEAVIAKCKRARCPRCNEWLGEAPTRFRASAHELDVVCACGAMLTTTMPRYMYTGAPLDPYFLVPLWLRTQVKGEVLWAYNDAHLRFLHSYLGGTLRRRAPNHKWSLVTVLPAWMKSATNREEVLGGLQRMADRAGIEF